MLLAMGCDRGARVLYGVNAIRWAGYFGRQDAVRRLLGVAGTVASGEDKGEYQREVRSLYMSVMATDLNLGFYEWCVFID